MTEWRIEKLDPWSASGPGWANSGVTAELIGGAFVNEDGVLKEKRERITLYREDLSAEENLALSIGIIVHGVLSRRILNEVRHD